MARQKLKRILDSEEKPNIVQPGKPEFNMVKGKWSDRIFQNDRPIILELGCGKGEYTVGLARQMPGSNFVGVDIKGPRIWVGADMAIQEGLENVRFLRAHIHNLDMFFGPEEVSEIWLPFPDPRMRLSDERRRLTGPRFLAMYRKILTAKGLIHLKTDNDPLYAYTLDLVHKLGLKDIEFTDNLYSSELLSDHMGIQTYFENKYLDKGLHVKYLKFRFD
jgi:tRNA (guanine-N7-)-methyltransferase